MSGGGYVLSKFAGMCALNTSTKLKETYHVTGLMNQSGFKWDKEKGADIGPALLRRDQR